MSWQPIETIPKDGECVLIAMRHGCIAVGFAFPAQNSGDWSKFASHWMHIPPIPVPTVTEEKA